MGQAYFNGFAMPAAGIVLLIAALHPTACTTLPEAIENRGVCAKNTLDDGNPCTNDQCDPGNISQVLHTPLADQTPCSLGANEGICEAGTCKLSCTEARNDCFCGEPGDCGQDTECSKWECSAEGKCSLNTLGQETQIGDDGNACTEDFCQGGQAVHPPKADKTACSSDTLPIGVCYGGACVECMMGDDEICGAGDKCFTHNGTAQCSHCGNGVIDDGELGIDCGALCPSCPLGTACDASRANECASGHCVDGVCCENVCSGQCKACSAQGKCEDLDQGMDDASKPCPAGSVCGPQGSNECLKKAGEPCAMASECLSNKCSSSVCASP